MKASLSANDETVPTIPSSPQHLVGAHILWTSLIGSSDGISHGVSCARRSVGMNVLVLQALEMASPGWTRPLS
jgi:hypothetical protein